MTTRGICAGAPLHSKVTWHSIDWATCHREVRRLQARIVKATQEGRHGRVKALQWLLTHSFSGKALAVKRVTENQGKRTAGVDGVTWLTPQAKSQAMLSLKRRGYQPKPLRRILIPKSNGKMRPLGIPTMKDRAMQALYLLALEPVAETIADKRSFGFRPERSTADAMDLCFSVLARKDKPQWILEGDIKGCFDNISHDWLLNRVPTDRLVLRKWLKVGYMENRQLFPTETGTPQGGIISPTLANLVLDGLETKLEASFTRRRNQNGIQVRSMVNYVRYADDFIVTVRSKELLENEVKPLIEDFMRERGLTLSPEKTRMTHIDDGFDFLGQNVRKYNGKLLIKPSKANTKAFLDKVRLVIKENKSANQISLIHMMNPMIRGWTNFHQHIVAKEMFSYVDHEIWKALWKWAKRRHPDKGKRWIKQRYFHNTGSRDWVFAAATGETHKGKFNLLMLRKAADAPIRRHQWLNLEANPYDPKWEMYFEQRHSSKMLNSLKGREKHIRLWKEQNGRCLICRQPITKETGWHIHHIIRRVDGGKDGNSNLVMLHPNCHRQTHAEGLEVVKPARVSGF